VTQRHKRVNFSDLVLFDRTRNQRPYKRYRGPQKSLDSVLTLMARRKITGQRNRIDAARTACHWFDEARYRERHGLTAEVFW
jgi:hypothetical protein